MLLKYLIIYLVFISKVSLTSLNILMCLIDAYLQLRQTDLWMNSGLFYTHFKFVCVCVCDGVGMSKTEPRMVKDTFTINVMCKSYYWYNHVPTCSLLAVCVGATLLRTGDNLRWPSWPVSVQNKARATWIYKFNSFMFILEKITFNGDEGFQITSHWLRTLLIAEVPE